MSKKDEDDNKGILLLLLLGLGAVALYLLMGKKEQGVKFTSEKKFYVKIKELDTKDPFESTEIAQNIHELFVPLNVGTYNFEAVAFCGDMIDGKINYNQGLLNMPLIFGLNKANYWILLRAFRLVGSQKVPIDDFAIGISGTTKAVNDYFEFFEKSTGIKLFNVIGSKQGLTFNSCYVDGDLIALNNGVAVIKEKGSCGSFSESEITRVDLVFK